MVEKSEADRLVGPFYRVEQLVSLGFTIESISKLIGERKVLSMTTSSGTVVFPTFQFGQDG